MAEGSITVEQNLGLVHTCAKRFKGRGIEYDDLFQAGCVGLVKAADNFDVGRGFRFSTYAVPVILGEIKRLFRDGGAVKLSRGLKELSLRVSREAEAFQHRTGREPTVSELASQLSLQPEQIIEALNAALQPVSLTVSEEENQSQADIPVESPDENITEHLALQAELKRLEKRDRSLIELRFYRGLTQTRTAELLGMTQVQVSRREKKLLLLLRERLQ